MSIIAEVIRSKIFLKTKDTFDLTDNKKLTVEDGKVAKVVPLYSNLNDAFVRYSVCQSKLNIDESVIPNFGRHSCKMFIRAKSIGFGYKVFFFMWPRCFSISLDYLTWQITRHQQTVGITCFKCTGRYLKHYQNTRFITFFTSYQLLVDFPIRDVKTIETVRDN